MKADVFKKLIKEAVREAVREELKIILSEDIKPKSTSIGTGGKGTVNNTLKYESYKPSTQKAKISTGDPIMDLLEETRASMINSPDTGYYQDVSQYVSAPGLGESNYKPVMVEENFSRPEPGLDISQFDFVKNAAAIFKASEQKDKERLG